MRTIQFVIVLWERILVQRPLIFAAVPNTEAEWRRRGFPMGAHNYSQNPFIRVPKGNKEKRDK